MRFEFSREAHRLRKTHGLCVEMRLIASLQGSGVALYEILLKDVFFIYTQHVYFWINFPEC